MRIADLIQKAQKLHLRTEMELFLAHLLSWGRLDLLARREEEIPAEHLAALQKALVNLMKGIPVAYLIHHKEFYGLDFYVDERVLVPRGETERLVDFVLEAAKALKGEIQVLEVGTGSGVIACSLKKMNVNLQIEACDVSEGAIEVAQKNAYALQVEVNFFVSDLLQATSEGADIVVANLPYIGTETHNFVAENVESHEPHVALFGGSDGLRLYARLFEELKLWPHKPAFIFGEIGFSQGGDVEQLCTKFMPDYSFELRQDYQDLDRYFVLQYRG